MTQRAAGASVLVSVTINAEPETVWKFLSEEDKLLAWMTYIPGMPAPAGSRFEPRAGGELRIIFPNGGQAKGTIVELEAQKRLVFTWGYDPDVAKTGLGPGACRVEIALVAVREGTRVTLTHTGPLTDELAKGHEAGWRHYLSQLAVRSAEFNLERTLNHTIEAYFAAWTETDDHKRRGLLDACCVENVRVLTSFACCQTLEEFSKHIANALRHMPGVRLQLDGEVKHIHGTARVPWKASGPDGRTCLAGENFVRFSPAGKIEEIVSFQK